MQGYLKKKGEISVTSSWRTRWFVLKNRFLYYFKSPQHSTSAGAIPLGKCTVKAVELEAKDKDKDSQEFCFEIVTNYRYVVSHGVAHLAWRGILLRACCSCVVSVVHSRFVRQDLLSHGRYRVGATKVD
jgi:hypothetical protein